MSWQQRVGDYLLSANRPILARIVLHLVVGILAGWGAFVLLVSLGAYLSALLNP
jgi:hypothetical protein